MPLVMVPTWGLKDQVTAVFVVPVTCTVKIVLCPLLSDARPVEDRVRATGVRVIVAVAALVESATLVEVSATISRLLIVAGAVYTPFTTAPTSALRDQVTAVLPFPVTEAVKFAEAPPPSDTAAGATVTPTATPDNSKDTAELAILVASATLLAVTVTVCWLATMAG